MNPLEEKKMYFYESFASEFDSKMNMYDTLKRVSVFYEELLTENIEGKLLLDAGCGTGWFSKAAVERGAKVTSMDLGEGLLEEVKKKCTSKRIVGSILEIPFEENSFDIIVSSEVIEHIPNPLDAIDELYRVLKPGGTLILSTPNRLWYFSLRIANALKIRPYQGLENWVWRSGLKNKLKNTGFKVEQFPGIHLFPFIFSFTYPLLDFCHKFNNILAPFMVNMAVRCTKISQEKR